MDIQKRTRRFTSDGIEEEEEEDGDFMQGASNDCGEVTVLTPCYSCIFRGHSPLLYK